MKRMAEYKANERARKRADGLTPKHIWLTQEALKVLDEYRTRNNTTYDEAASALLCSGQLAAQPERRSDMAGE